MTSREEQLNHIKFLQGIHQYSQKSEQWLNQRKNRLTSSDAATALGLNPYKKPVELLLEKCGAGRQFFGNEHTVHGETYEDEAIEKYCKLMGKTNYDFGMISYGDLDPIRKNPKYKREDLNFLGGSVDGVTIDNDNQEGLMQLEVKCPMRRKIKHSQIPDYYLPQVQLNMFIYELDATDFIEYIPGTLPGTTQELNIKRIYRDEKWFDKQIPKLIAFWNDVLYWRQRDITTHPEYSKYYKPKRNAKYLFIETDEERPKSKI